MSASTPRHLSVLRALRGGVSRAGRVLAAGVAILACSAQAATLTETEQRWLQGAWPVIEHARQQQLPLDIVVQPQPTPGNSPLALSYVAGRCKLVLSMRGNPEAEAILARIPADLLAPALELMAAHELGHCQRWLHGAWAGLPAGFSAVEPEGLSADRLRAWMDMQAARREEGFGDLVGLAWTRHHHPAAYPRLHAWLLAERLADHTPGSPHDTVVWVRLATDGGAFTGDDPLRAADALWQAGLLAEAEPADAQVATLDPAPRHP